MSDYYIFPSFPEIKDELEYRLSRIKKHLEDENAIWDVEMTDVAARVGILLERGGRKILVSKKVKVEQLGFSQIITKLEPYLTKDDIKNMEKVRDLRNFGAHGQLTNMGKKLD